MGEFFYDGTTISPFEVVFVAMNTLVVENNWSFARQAAIYQAWLQLQVRRSAFPPCASNDAGLVHCYPVFNSTVSLLPQEHLWCCGHTKLTSCLSSLTDEQHPEL